MVALLRLVILAVGEALGMRFTARSIWAALAYGGVAAVTVLSAIAEDGKVTNLELTAVCLAFIATSAAAFTRTKLSKQ